MRVTTETETGKWNFRFLWAILALYGIAGLYFAFSFAFLPERLLPFPVPGVWFRVFVSLIGAWSTVVVLLVPRSIARGEWRLDAEGIVYDSIRGDHRMLKWRDVEAVRWGGERIALRSGRSVLMLVLDFEPPERREEVRMFLRESLTAFDLRDLQMHTFSLRRLGLCLAFAVLIVVLALAAELLHSMYLTPVGIPQPIGFWWVLGPFIGWVVYRGMQEARKSWRLPQATKED